MDRLQHHIPLRAGIRIVVGGAGTLTGLATRNSDGTPVLVTNLHVLSPSFSPSGREGMYSGRIKIGGGPWWVGEGWVSNNDAAAFELLSDVPATHHVHSHPGGDLTSHESLPVIAGSLEPRRWMKVLIAGSTSGLREARITETNATLAPGLRLQYGLIGLSGSSEPGDSGAPVLSSDEAGNLRTVGVLIGSHPFLPFSAAVPASRVESALGITFGQPPAIDERPMKMPVLTASGFEGRRIIIDDYFKAGQDLNAGDVVGIKDTTDGPRLLRIAPQGAAANQVIGVVLTPSGGRVGDRVAPSGESVPVVVKGVTKAFTAESMGVGDPVAPAGSWATASQGYAVARIKKAGSGDTILGRCLSTTPLDHPANQVVDIIVDIAGVGIGSPTKEIESSTDPLAYGAWFGVQDRWEEGSVARHGTSGKFYNFAVEEDIDNADLYLKSDAASRLFLIDRADGAVLDFAEGEIIRPLQPGRYMVEVVTDDPVTADGQPFSLALAHKAELSNLAVTPGPNSVEVTCEAPSTTPPNAGYSVRVSKGGSVARSVVVGSFPATVNGLEIDTAYTVEVSVVFEAPGLEAKAFSNTLSGSFTTDDFGRVVGENAEIGGVWVYTAGTDAYPESGLADALAALEDRIWTQLSGTAADAAAALTLVGNGWSPAHALVYADPSDGDAAVYYAFEMDTAPAPVNLTAEQSDVTGTFIRYEFEEPTGFPEAGDYRLEVSNSTGAVHSFILADAGSGLVSVTPGDNYTVKVASRLFAPDGREVLSDYVTASVDVEEVLWTDSLSDAATPVTAPTSLTVYPEGPETGGFGVRLECDGPDPLPTDFDGYYLEVGPTDRQGPTSSKQLASDATSWTTTVRPHDGRYGGYTARVAAKVTDTNGVESYSDWVTTTFTVPDSPTNLAVTHDLIDQTVTATFDAPADVPTDADYSYSLSDSSGELVSGHESSTNISVTAALRLGATYTVTLETRLVDSNGEEWLSHPASASDTVPVSSWNVIRLGGGDTVEAPIGFSASQPLDQILLAWTAASPLPDGFEGYYLEAGPSASAPEDWHFTAGSTYLLAVPPLENGSPVEYTYRVATVVEDPDGSRRFSDFVSATFAAQEAAVHEDHQDHIDVAAVSHDDHQDHDDLPARTYDDHQDHTDVEARTHQDHDDHDDVAGSHQDHDDHDDVAGTHQDHDDHDDVTGPHQDHDDHDDVAGRTHSDHQDHEDAGGTPHSDHDDHDDVYYNELDVHVDHQDHDDFPAITHEDYQDHNDVAAAPYQDHDDHDDVAGSHQDHDDHDDVTGPHQDHSDHDDVTGPHQDHHDHDDVAGRTHGDHDDHDDVAGRPHSDHQDHDDVAATAHSDHDDHDDSS